MGIRVRRDSARVLQSLLASGPLKKKKKKKKDSDIACAHNVSFSVPLFR